MDKILLPELMANLSRIFAGLNMIREAKNDVIRSCPDELLDDALFETLDWISDGEFENEADAVTYMRGLGFPITDEN